MLLQVKEYIHDYTYCNKTGTNVTCADIIANNISSACECKVTIELKESFEVRYFIFFMFGTVIFFLFKCWFCWSFWEFSTYIQLLLQSTVYLYYGLTNFYQNHRRYVKSRDDSQLLGREGILSTNCEPFDYEHKEDGKKIPIAPCGAIANSLFNGAF